MLSMGVFLRGRVRLEDAVFGIQEPSVKIV